MIDLIDIFNQTPVFAKTLQKQFTLLLFQLYILTLLLAILYILPFLILILFLLWISLLFLLQCIRQLFSAFSFPRHLSWSCVFIWVDDLIDPSLIHSIFIYETFLSFEKVRNNISFLVSLLKLNIVVWL